MNCGQRVSILAYGKTNVSTKEKTALKGAWISISDEDFNRTKCSEETSCQGSKKALRLGYVAAGKSPTF
jgi:hypothetical protein